MTTMYRPRYLQGWEVIFVTIRHDSNFLWNHSTKQTFERLSPLMSLCESWPGSRAVPWALWSTRKCHEQHPRLRFQIWQACGGCGSSPGFSKNCWSGSACNEHRQKSIASNMHFASVVTVGDSNPLLQLVRLVLVLSVQIQLMPLICRYLPATNIQKKYVIYA